MHNTSMKILVKSYTAYNNKATIFKQNSRVWINMVPLKNYTFIRMLSKYLYVFFTERLDQLFKIGFSFVDQLFIETISLSGKSAGCGGCGNNAKFNSQNFVTRCTALMRGRFLKRALFQVRRWTLHRVRSKELCFQRLSEVTTHSLDCPFESGM